MDNDIKKFKSRTKMTPMDNVKNEDLYVIAVDYGYSTTKIFAPNKTCVFPSFAKRLSDDVESVGAPSPNDIEYVNLETDEQWLVGEVALSFASSSDTDLALFGRNRYFADSFKVIAETGIALGMMNNKFGGFVADPNGKKPDGNKRMFVQTGLPPKYRGKKVDGKHTGDDAYLISVLKGRHHFAIRKGDSDWVNFDFVLEEDDINIIDQPKGGLISATLNAGGDPSADSARISNANCLVLDIGFGTADIYKIACRKISDKETMDDMGMKRVFEKTIRKIDAKYGKQYSVIQLQNLLEKGIIKSFDRMTKETKVGNISELLFESSKEVCKELLDKVMDMYDITDIEYIILDGGTAEAWSEYIKEYFAGFGDMVSIVSAVKEAPSIDPIFANARGYYMLRNHKKRK